MNGAHLLITCFICLIPWGAFFVWCRTKGNGGEKPTSAVTDLLLTLGGFIATVSVCQGAGNAFTFCISSVVLTCAMLAASSREDLKSGTFFVLPLVACVAMNAFTAFLAGGFRNSAGFFTMPFWKEALVVAVVLLALCLGGLAKGDAVIYLCCWLSFLTVFRDASFPAFFLMLLTSNVIALFTWLVRIARKKPAGGRFAFTTQICVGCYVSYIAFGLLI